MDVRKAFRPIRYILGEECAALGLGMRASFLYGQREVHRQGVAGLRGADDESGTGIRPILVFFTKSNL